MCSWLVFWEDSVRESDCELTHADSLHEKLTEHLCCLHQIENRSKQRMKGKGVVREGSSYSLRIHLHQGLWLKTDESVNVSLMHQFCKIECLPSCYLWCFSLYYVSVFIIGTICSLFFPNFILSSIDSRLTYFVRSILLRLNSNLDVLYVNIISCTSNFLEFEACINTLLVLYHLLRRSLQFP